MSLKAWNAAHFISCAPTCTHAHRRACTRGAVCSRTRCPLPVAAGLPKRALAEGWTGDGEEAVVSASPLRAGAALGQDRADVPPPAASTLPSGSALEGFPSPRLRRCWRAHRKARRGARVGLLVLLRDVGGMLQLRRGAPTFPSRGGGSVGSQVCGDCRA